MKLTRNQQTVYDMIPIGKDNAISRKDLAKALELTDRTVRMIISELVIGGYPVCSSGGFSGYWKPTNTKEVIEVRDEIHDKAMHLLAREKGLNKYIEVHSDQLEIES